MIAEEFKLPDNIKDDVNILRKKMLSLNSWNKEKYKLKESLEKLLLSKKYICFLATNPERYRLGSIGDSYLYDVPLYKRGHLKKFRGKRIRLICMHAAGHATRILMAGVVSKSPPDKVIKKLIIKYSFPKGLESNNVIFKTRRFKLFELNKGDKLSFPDSNEHVNLTGAKSVLIDGKNCLLIAAIISDKHKKIQAKLMSFYSGEFVLHKNPTQFNSYKDIIDYYRKYVE